MDVSKDAIVSAINKKSKKGQISCKAALSIAEELEVAPKQVGNIINELKIKIRACQLGCFN